VLLNRLFVLFAPTYTPPVVYTLPSTASFCPGRVVPIPTFPVDTSINIYSLVPSYNLVSSVISPPSLKVVVAKLNPFPAEYVVFVSVAFIVIESALSFVVIDTFVPATNVNVSVNESATTLFCPDTANVLNSC
jgi:hypothetical protein